MSRRLPELLRSAAPLALGVYALHQLRYLIAFGDQSSQALAHQGHSYLHDLLPVLLALLLAALCGAVLLPARAGRPRASGSSLAALWAACSAALLGNYCAQELAEGALAAGHPVGLAGLLDHGGSVAPPLALALGALCALVLRGIGSLSPAPAARNPLSRSGGRRAPLVARPSLVATRSGLDFGLGVATRPPPLPAR